MERNTSVSFRGDYFENFVDNKISWEDMKNASEVILRGRIKTFSERRWK